MSAHSTWTAILAPASGHSPPPPSTLSTTRSTTSGCRLFWLILVHAWSDRTARVPAQIIKSMKLSLVKQTNDAIKTCSKAKPASKAAAAAAAAEAANQAGSRGGPRQQAAHPADGAEGRLTASSLEQRNRKATQCCRSQLFYCACGGVLLFCCRCRQAPISARLETGQCGRQQRG
jgi:hypothetical protein